MFKCLMSAELPGVDYVEDVLLELEREIEIVQQATKQNHKVAKVRLFRCAFSLCIFPVCTLTQSLVKSTVAYYRCTFLCCRQRKPF